MIFVFINMCPKKQLIFENFSGIIRPVADVAQLVELLICNQWVRGSSPCVGTIFLSPLKSGLFLCLNRYLFKNIDKISKIWYN